MQMLGRNCEFLWCCCIRMSRVCNGPSWQGHVHHLSVAYVGVCLSAYGVVVFNTTIVPRDWVEVPTSVWLALRRLAAKNQGALFLSGVGEVVFPPS